MQSPVPSWCPGLGRLVISSGDRRAVGSRFQVLRPYAAKLRRWVLSWRLNEEGDSSGDRRAVGSRFQVLRPYAAKLR